MEVDGSERLHHNAKHQIHALFGLPELIKGKPIKIHALVSAVKFLTSCAHRVTGCG
jgi:hypothetical protein